jgi:hypothetical protein
VALLAGGTDGLDGTTKELEELGARTSPCPPTCPTGAGRGGDLASRGQLGAIDVWVERTQNLGCGSRSLRGTAAGRPLLDDLDLETEEADSDSRICAANGREASTV